MKTNDLDFYFTQIQSVGFRFLLSLVNYQNGPRGPKGRAVKFENSGVAASSYIYLDMREPWRTARIKTITSVLVSPAPKRKRFVLHEN